MSFFRVCELIYANGTQGNEEAKIIIRNESLYNAADAADNTLLHHASQIGNYEIVQFLVNSGSNVDACNNFKQTPLVSTLVNLNQCVEVIDILLDAGASMSKEDMFGNSAITIVNCIDWLGVDTKRYKIYKSFLKKADDLDYFSVLIYGNEQMIKMLLETNIDVTISDSEGCTLVHILAHNSNPGVMALLRNKNIDINALTTDGWTPLMHATLYGAKNSVEFLLDEGANTEATGYEKKTPLYIAYEEFVNEKDLECIQLLLERGANAQVEVENYIRPTIFDLILKNKNFSAGNLALAHLALQEAIEANITQLIYSKINSHDQLKTYFEKCRQQITTKIHRSVTLLDILTVTDRKLERNLRDKELASKVVAFKAVDYFDTILRKRLSKACLMIELTKAVAPIIGELIRINFDSYSSIMDKIAGYLDKEDLERLLLVDRLDR